MAKLEKELAERTKDYLQQKIRNPWRASTDAIRAKEDEIAAKRNTLRLWTAGSAAAIYATVVFLYNLLKGGYDIRQLRTIMEAGAAGQADRHLLRRCENLSATYSSDQIPTQNELLQTACNAIRPRAAAGVNTEQDDQSIAYLDTLRLQYGLNNIEQIQNNIRDHERLSTLEATAHERGAEALDTNEIEFLLASRQGHQTEAVRNRAQRIIDESILPFVLTKTENSILLSGDVLLSPNEYRILSDSAEHNQLRRDYDRTKRIEELKRRIVRYRSGFKIQPIVREDLLALHALSREAFHFVLSKHLMHMPNSIEQDRATEAEIGNLRLLAEYSDDIAEFNRTSSSHQLPYPNQLLARIEFRNLMRAMQTNLATNGFMEDNALRTQLDLLVQTDSPGALDFSDKIYRQEWKQFLERLAAPNTLFSKPQKARLRQTGMPGAHELLYRNKLKKIRVALGRHRTFSQVPCIKYTQYLLPRADSDEETRTVLRELDAFVREQARTRRGLSLKKFQLLAEQRSRTGTPEAHAAYEDYRNRFMERIAEKVATTPEDAAQMITTEERAFIYMVTTFYTDPEAENFLAGPARTAADHYDIRGWQQRGAQSVLLGDNAFFPGDARTRSHLARHASSPFLRNMMYDTWRTQQRLNTVYRWAQGSWEGVPGYPEIPFAYGKACLDQAVKHRRRNEADKSQEWYERAVKAFKYAYQLHSPNSARHPQALYNLLHLWQHKNLNPELPDVETVSLGETLLRSSNHIPLQLDDADAERNLSQKKARYTRALDDLNGELLKTRNHCSRVLEKIRELDRTSKGQARRRASDLSEQLTHARRRVDKIQALRTTVLTEIEQVDLQIVQAERIRVERERHEQRERERLREQRERERLQRERERLQRERERREQRKRERVREQRERERRERRSREELAESMRRLRELAGRPIAPLHQPFEPFQPLFAPRAPLFPGLYNPYPPLQFQPPFQYRSFWERPGFPFN